MRAGVVSSRMVFPDDGSYRIIETWRPPSELDAEDLAAVELHLSRLEDLLRPADRGELLGRVLALLSHFRADPHPPEIEARLADDWAEDLGRFPIWAVEDAARTWRRSRRFRPQICEMVSLCEAACGARLTERDRLRSVVEAGSRVSNPFSSRFSDLARATFPRPFREGGD